jgi:hypothetical protein
MPRLWIPLLVILGLCFGPNPGIQTSVRDAHAAKSKASVAGIPLPPRARIQDDGTYRAAQSYRKTVVYFERYLRRQGIFHKRVPTYQVRGVLGARFLSDSPRSQWLAIHVYRIRGMTHVFIVPRSLAPNGEQNEPSSKE